MPYSRVSFRMTLSDLAKYSVISRSLSAKAELLVCRSIDVVTEWVAAVTVRRVKYTAERRRIINNLHQGRTPDARRAADDAAFKCSLNKRSQFPVPLSMSAAAERRQRGAGVTSNGAQVNKGNPGWDGSEVISDLGCLRGTVVERRSLTGELSLSIYALRSTCSWWGKPSAVGHPSRPTQPFILSGTINE